MKRTSLISLLVFVMVVIIDLAMKFNSLNNKHTSVNFNKGFIFGTLQDLPQSLTLVTLTSFGGILFFIYLLLILLLSSNLQSLKIGLGLFCGGIIGNVVDRAIHGGTIDFIPIEIFGTSIVFNMADFFQWIGATIIFYNIIKRDTLIWHPENQRGFNLVNIKEQVRFASKFSLLSLSTCLVIGIFSTAFLTLILNENHLYQRSSIIAFVVSYSALSLFFVIMTFFSGLVLSQKTAGPLYAFEKYVEQLLSGERKELRLREGDNYKHLEEVAFNLKNYFEKNSK